MISFKNDFYVKLFEIAFFRDFFKIVVSKKKNYEILKKIAPFKIAYSNQFFI